MVGRIVYKDRIAIALLVVSLLYVLFRKRMVLLSEILNEDEKKNILQMCNYPTLDRRDIQNIYDNLVDRPQTYEKECLAWEDRRPELFGNYVTRGRDAARLFTLVDFKSWILTYNIRPRRCLVTDKNDPELFYLPHCDVKEVAYDARTGINDLHTLELNDTNYDFFLMSQTLEHLYNPLRSLQSIRKHLMDDGIIFTSVPFFNILHMTPHHFQHFTPTGLATLFVSAGFKVIELGCWGNAYYQHYLVDKNSWPDIHELTSIQNDKMRPVQCWILARKVGWQSLCSNVDFYSP